MDTNPIFSALKLVLTTFIRYAIVAVCAWLVKKGIFDQGTSAALQDPIVIASIVGALLATATGIYLRLKSRFKTNTALKMPANSTPDDLNAVVKDATLGQVLSTAAPSKAQINSAPKNV
jgi:hypothetical protein